MADDNHTALLLVIKSPLQALNAVEYYHNLSPPPNAVQAITFSPENRPELGLTIAGLLKLIPHIYIHSLNGIPSERDWWYSIREFLSARKFMRRLATASRQIPVRPLIALGDYRSRECRAVAALFPKAKITLLDDGSATHQIARYRRSPYDSRLAPMFPRYNLRTFRLWLWARIQLTRIQRLTFFTCYPITTTPDDTVFRHDYPFWRSILGQLQQNTGPSVLFLGMSHVEKGLTDLTRYLSALRKIHRYYRGAHILYRPHRDENSKKLAAVRQLGFNVLQHDITPIELVLINSATLPVEIACIASSAIDNLSVIFQGRLAIRCFVPDDNYCSAVMSGHLKDILGHHVASGVPNFHATVLADLSDDS